MRVFKLGSDRGSTGAETVKDVPALEIRNVQTNNPWNGSTSMGVNEGWDDRSRGRQGGSKMHILPLKCASIDDEEKEYSYMRKKKGIRQRV
jgi:hypothetical protein